MSQLWPAVGGGGTIIHTTNGGQSWLPQSSGVGTDLNAVSFVDAQHGWAVVGDFGTVLRTTDGGAQWQPVSTGSSAILLATDFADSMNGWVVGMFGEIMHTTNGGLLWVPQTGVFPPDWLWGVHFIDTDTGWTVGFDGKVMHTSDGGANWGLQPSGTHAQLNDCHFVDAQQGWAVGWDGTIIRASVRTTAVGDEEAPAASAPAEGPRLYANVPNPFNPETTIRYTLPADGRVELDIFDALGREVRQLVAGHRPSGDHRVRWDGIDGSGRRVQSGVYFYRLEFRGVTVAVRKMLVVK